MPWPSLDILFVATFINVAAMERGSAEVVAPPDADAATLDELVEHVRALRDQVKPFQDLAIACQVEPLDEFRTLTSECRRLLAELPNAVSANLDGYEARLETLVDPATIVETQLPATIRAVARVSSAITEVRAMVVRIDAVRNWAKERRQEQRAAAKERIEARAQLLGSKLAADHYDRTIAPFCNAEVPIDTDEYRAAQFAVPGFAAGADPQTSFATQTERISAAVKTNADGGLAAGLLVSPFALAKPVVSDVSDSKKEDTRSGASPGAKAADAASAATTDAGANNRRAQRAWGQRALDGVFIRFGSFDDRRTRIGGGASIPLTGTGARSAREQDFARREFGSDVLATLELAKESASCKDRAKAEKKIEKDLEDRRGAFETVCERIVLEAADRCDLSKESKRKQWSSALKACGVVSSSDPLEVQKLTSVGGAVSLAGELESCEGQAASALRSEAEELRDEAAKLNTPILFNEHDYQAFESRRAELEVRRREIREAFWTAWDVRLGVESYADLDSIAWAQFHIVDEMGEEQRLPRGLPNRAAANAELNFQRAGGRIGISGGYLGKRDDDETDFVTRELAYDHGGHFKLEFQCVIASLDRDKPLSIERKTDSNAVAPMCGRAKARQVNPKVLGKGGKLDVPTMGFFLDFGMELDDGKADFEDERRRISKLRAATGLSFAVNDNLKFRLGVPFEMLRIEQKAISQPVPGLRVPPRRGYQFSFPVFIVAVFSGG